jgi:hypothetical protein
MLSTPFASYTHISYNIQTHRTWHHTKRRCLNHLLDRSGTSQLQNIVSQVVLNGARDICWGPFCLPQGKRYSGSLSPAAVQGRATSPCCQVHLGNPCTPTDAVLHLATGSWQSSVLNKSVLQDDCWLTYMRSLQAVKRNRWAYFLSVPLRGSVLGKARDSVNTDHKQRLHFLSKLSRPLPQEALHNFCSTLLLASVEMSEFSGFQRRVLHTHTGRSSC